MSFLLEVRLKGVNLDVDPETTSFIYDEVIQGSSTFQLHVTSDSWEKWDRLVTVAEPQGMRLKWGDLDGETERWSSWKYVLADAKFRYLGDTVEVWVEGVDGGFALNEQTHGLAFRDRTIAEVVAKIAAKNNFRNTRIEPTRGRYTLYQGTYKDAQFICNVLLPAAVSTAGRADYSFYFEDGNRLVFAPLDLDKVVASYTADFRPDEVEEGTIQLQDVECRRLFRSEEGSYATQYRGFDPLRKEPLFRTANDDTVGFSYLAEKRPTSPRTIAEVALAIGETQALVDGEGRAGWSQNARRLFRTELYIDYDYAARAGTVVNLTVTDPDGKVHWTSGKWLIYKVQQWYRPRGEGTILYLERRAHA